VLARAKALERQGRDIIHLEIGEPDFDTPANIRDAAKRAIDAGWTHYAPPLGLPALRDAIAADATTRKGFEVPPERVVVTPGAKPIMFFAMLALIDDGDEVIYPDPGFPIYESMSRYAGGRPVPLPIRQEHGFRADLEELASLITPRTRLLVINSPANPTGGIFTREDIGRIAALAREHDLVVLADEIYGRIVHRGEHVSIAALPGMADRTIVLDGFSKTYAMTGWRLGYAIVPEALLPHYSRLIINSVSCTAAFSQLAAVEALTGPQDDVEAMVGEFRARRDLVVAGLNRIPGIRCLEPDGAFYVFPDVRGLFGRPLGANRRAVESSNELAGYLLEDGQVSTVPGEAFGTPGFLRLSYALAMPLLEQGVSRIQAALH
jgi:aspartate/methionine/tyrosine aminotransferase